MDWLLPWAALFGPMVIAIVGLGVGRLGWRPSDLERRISKALEDVVPADWSEADGARLPRERGRASGSLERDEHRSWPQDIEEVGKSLWKRYPYFSMS